MNRKLLATAICATLMMGGSAYAQNTDQQTPDTTQSQADAQKAKTLDSVVVTGSLIPRSEKESASPVIKITKKELQAEGFRNVYDALKTLSVSTGSTQDNAAASQGTFTPGATTISLFGLDPSFTLILLNGHPLADYPVPYNGGQNITDLSNIPTEMVDHIDILSGGASSIYGSSAIAGVVNIVLLKHVDGMNLNVRGGGYRAGGGKNGRIEFTGGAESGKLSVNYGFSLQEQKPIDLLHSFWPSRSDNPLAGSNPVQGRDFLILGVFTGPYIDPGAAQCAKSSGLFGGTNTYNNRPGFGHFCGSLNDSSTATILNKDQSANGYFNFDYAINDNTDAYAEVLYGYSKQKSNGGPNFFSSANVPSASPYFWDPQLGDFIGALQREFAPEEGGSIVDNIDTRQYNLNIGLKGGFGSSNWTYDAFYNRSQVNTNESELWPLAQPFTDYYMGPQQGTDPFGYGYSVYTPDLNRFFTPLTPAQFAAMSAPIKSRSVSWEQEAHVTIGNADLFKVPGGSAGIALIAEVGNQAFNNPADPRLIAGDFLARTGTQGSGNRSREAVGGEFRIPVASEKVVADLSARWDSYSFAGRTDAKPTYKIGLEFRPIQSLLLRANYATAFRAPDMISIFQGASGFFEGGITDQYTCRLAGFTAANIGQCPDANGTVFSTFTGSPDLKDITAKTFSAGFVWSPTRNWDLQADYNHISITNEVEAQSLNDLLELDANCRLGTSFGGQTFDINSPQCQQVESQIHRLPPNNPFNPNGLQSVDTFPVNVASEVTSGIQASTTYRMDIGRFGKLMFGGNYYVELSHKQQPKPGDAFTDLLHNFNSYEAKSRATGDVAWNIGNWTTTVYGTLYGKTVNYLGTATTGRMALFNGSVSYDLGDKSYVSLTVNNIGNRKPPLDIMSSAPGPQLPGPYFNAFVYNGLGAAYWLEYNKHF